MNLEEKLEEVEEKTSMPFSPARSTATSVSTIASFKSALDVSPSTSTSTMMTNERKQLLRESFSSNPCRLSKGYQTIISDEECSSNNSFSGSNEDIFSEDIHNKRPSLHSNFEASTNYYIYTVTILSAIGGFLFGYDTGIVSGAMIFIKYDNNF